MNTISDSYLLLIDDDEEDLTFLATSLQALGIKTKSFNSADKAMSYLELISEKSELPVMIVSDYNMPGINGKQVLGLVKGNKKTVDIPVVVYSSIMPQTLRDVLLKLGAFDCFIKPGSLKDLSLQVKLLKELSFPATSQVDPKIQPEFSLN
jgi:CheY-like chemotaxis protein